MIYLMKHTLKNTYILVKHFSNPQTEAMLQAFYSRSHKSIKEHLKDLDIPLEDEVNEKELTIQKKLQQYYIGYGHASIGDCGSTTVFIENVSLMAAKAIQHTPLYNGQESSTRYIDFEVKKEVMKDSLIELSLDYLKSSYYNMLDVREGEVKFMKGLFPFVDRIFDFYKAVKLETVNKIVNSAEKGIDSKEMKAINAFSFDVARGYLPVGTLTQLSFHGTLRVLKQQFTNLLSHPLPEVKRIAYQALLQLNEKYPYAFNREIEKPDFSLDIKALADKYGLILDQNNYCEEDEDGYFENEEVSYTPNRYRMEYEFSENKNYYHNESLISKGPIVICASTLDYGSWRDLQRHRNTSQLEVYPCDLDWDIIHPFYKSYLTPNLEETYKTLISDIEAFIEECKDFIDPEFFTYLNPIGQRVTTTMAMSPKEYEYILKLRTKKTVHPTLVMHLLSINNYLADLNRRDGTNNWFEQFRDDSYTPAYCLQRADQDIVKRIKNDQKC